MTDTKTSKPNRARRMAREPLLVAINGAEPDANPSAPPSENVSIKPQTKAGLVEDLLDRDKGASLDELCQATGWLPHTCRAFLTGLRKKGRNLERAKREDGTTCYKLAPAEAVA